jgi:hypothetical protein
MPTMWRWTRDSFFASLQNSLDRLKIRPKIYFIHTPVHPMFESWVDVTKQKTRKPVLLCFVKFVLVLFFLKIC